MGQISVEIRRLAGSVLSGNQHQRHLLGPLLGPNAPFTYLVEVFQ